MVRRRLPGAAAALLLALAPAGASAQPVQGPPFIKPSGAEFPERIGDFKRVSTNAVEPGRLGASYRRDGSDGLVDIFVAGAGMTVEEELLATEGMIGRVFSDLRAVRDLPAPAAAPTARGRLWTALSGSVPVYTATMIDRRWGWRIKIRGTVSRSEGEAGVAAIETFIRDYGWWGRKPD
ncbi:MAG: hypothetical protein ABWX67_09945 [Allosphingosinicella sp.]